MKISNTFEVTTDIEILTQDDYLRSRFASPSFISEEAVTVAKLYSPLFVRILANNNNLRVTHAGIERRNRERRQSVLGGRVSKSTASKAKDTKNKSDDLKTKDTMAFPGMENQPPSAVAAEPIWRENLNTRLICKDCREDPPNLVEENADTICGSCGMVLAERLISYDSEWRTFNSDEGKGDDPNRVGEVENQLLNENHLSTAIGGGSGKNASKLTRNLQRTQANQASIKNDKALTAVYKQIDTYADQAHLPGSVRQAAKSYYKRVDDAKAFKGKSTDSLIAGVLFIACRQCNVARSFAEIFALTNVSKKEIGRAYKLLEKFLTSDAQTRISNQENLGLTINKQTEQFVGSQSTKPEDLCPRYCSMLGLSERTFIPNLSSQLAAKITKIDNLAGRSPLSNAAACVYFMSHLLGHGKSSKDISQVAAVSDATIKHAYKILLENKDWLIDRSWLEAPKNGDVGRLPPS